MKSEVVRVTVTLLSQIPKEEGSSFLRFPPLALRYKLTFQYNEGHRKGITLVDILNLKRSEKSENTALQLDNSIDRHRQSTTQCAACSVLVVLASGMVLYSSSKGKGQTRTYAGTL